MNTMIETDSPEVFADEMEKLQDALPKKIEANPENAEKGLAKLVLTLIELIRKLMEKQAMRCLNMFPLEARLIHIACRGGLMSQKGR